MAKKKSRQTKTTTARQSSTKRGRGRPRKTPEAPSPASIPTVPPSPQIAPSPVLPAKRGRGRPRKATQSTTQIKRGRGRPRKQTRTTSRSSKLSATAEKTLIQDVTTSCSKLIETPNTAISEPGKQQLRETLVNALCSTKPCSL